MSERIDIGKIPQNIIEANGMEYDHEDNEYHVFHPCGMYINIPSNTKISLHSKEIAINAEINNVIIILWNESCSAPHISVVNFK